MEPWKVILLVAAIPAGIAVALSYLNGENLREKVEERERQQRNVVSLQERLDRTVAEIAEKERETIELNQETESSKTQLAQAESKLLELNAEIEAMNLQVTQAEQEIAAASELETMMVDFNQVTQQIAQTKQAIADEDQKINMIQNSLSVRMARKGDLERQIETYRTRDKNRKLGIMEKLEAQVSNAYNSWGFVVINAGDSEGVVTNATLDVFRQGQAVCKIRVTEVMPHESIGEIITSTLLPGQLVQVGDSVVHKGTRASAL